MIALRYGVSPQPGQAPWNSNNGWANWDPFTVSLDIKSLLYSTLLNKYPAFLSSPASREVAIGFITRAFSLAGHVLAQDPHPVQSREKLAFYIQILLILFQLVL